MGCHNSHVVHNVYFCSLTSRTPCEGTSETGGGETKQRMYSSSDKDEQSARKVTYFRSHFMQNSNYVDVSVGKVYIHI